MDSHRKINLIKPFSAFFPPDDHIHDYSLAEIIHDKPRKNFLNNGIPFLGIEIRNAYGVFQFAEAGFNAPTKMIMFF